MDTLTYKGYQASAEHDRERGLYRGRLLSIGDLVTYEAPTQPALRLEFEAAVDDYIDTCRKLGREPKRPPETNPIT